MSETEANDSLSTADSISIAFPIIGQLSSSLDVGYFALEAKGAGTLEVTFGSPTSSSLDFFTVSILDSAGNVIARRETGTDINLSTSADGAETHYATVAHN